MPSLTKAAPPKSDQLNSDDLIGGSRTITVRGVQVSGDGDQRVSVYFEGDNNKPFKPCKTMIRVMAHVWGDESENAVGQSMTLFCDPKVKFGGDAVGGIRISHMTGLKSAKSFGLTATRGRKAQYTVHPLQMERAAPQVDDARVANILEDARFAARKGGDGFKSWWTGPGKDDRAHILGYKDELIATAKAADDTGNNDLGPNDDIPFGDQNPGDDEPVTNENF